MREESGHIIYNAKDIHQYLTGKLAPAEMHAMEKAALNDPLLADAIDGFAASVSFKTEENFSQLQHDLSILKKKINNSPGIYKDTTWWKVAAAVIVLTGLSFAFYVITNHNDQQKEAGVLQQPIVKATSNDTISSAELKTTTASVNPAPKKEPTMSLPEKYKAEKDEHVEKKVATQISPNTFAAAIPAPISSGTLMDESISEEKKSAPVESNSMDQVARTNKIVLGKDTSGNNTGPRSQVEILYKKGVVPVMGWSAFLNYLEDQLSYSTYDDGRKVTGEMIIEFKIDSAFNTIPTEFYFEKSIDADVNNAVEELLQKQGQWKTDNNSTQGIVKLDIKF